MDVADNKQSIIREKTKNMTEVNLKGKKKTNF